MKVAVQMDPIETLDIEGDSTFALILEAQRRGHGLSVYCPDTLALEDGVLSALCRAVTVRDDPADHVRAGSPRRTPLDSFDVVLMRQDPPFDLHYITASFLLEALPPRTRVVNDPAAVRNAPEKLFVTEFRDLMPPTLITRDVEAMRTFYATHRDIVLKPLYGNGGAGIVHVSPNSDNLASLLELFNTFYREPHMVQAYLPDVRGGDKRIIFIEEQAVAAINRVPPPGDLRANMHAGGRAEPCELSARDREICARIGPALRERGFVFTGIDVIGGHLTEINVTSPTGIREVAKFGGPDIAALFWDAIEVC